MTLGPDGTIRVKCFGCSLAGDIFTLIAAARGLDPVRGFRDVLQEAAEIAGLYDVADEVRGGTPRERPSTPLPRAKPVAAPPANMTYPAAGELAALWRASGAVDADAAVSAWLASRAIPPATIAQRDLARALPAGALPSWARYQGETWSETGHRLLLPVFDAYGRMVSVRAGRVTASGDSPKRLPPAGHLAAGLVLANQSALAMLGHGARVPLLVVEGEPDFLTWASLGDEVLAVIGVGSGWWTKAHAMRVPSETRVVIRTHHDPAGDLYAIDVARKLAGRCEVLRSTAASSGDENDALRAGSLPSQPEEATVPLIVEICDPRSFVLGRIFAEHGWLMDEINPGVFTVRCPSEKLHRRGSRFDGSTVVKAPSQGASQGTFLCRHEPCRRIYDAFDEVLRSVERLAIEDGL